MSLDEMKWRKQEGDHLEVRDCISQSKVWTDALPSYEYLLGLRASIPKELYAYYLRKLLQFNTANVSVELRLKMLDGVNREDIMYQEELDALQNFGESITVYRGASRKEVKPGLSWSRRRDIAEGSEFYQGRLFVAKVCTSQILLYLMKDADEEEIVAYVVDNYQTIDK